MPDSRMKTLIKEAVSEELGSQKTRELLHQYAISSVEYRFVALNIGGERDDIEEFRANQQFISDLRKRCNKVYDRIWNVFGIICSAIAGFVFWAIQQWTQVHGHGG
jgi:hypothetical protein